MVQSKLENRDKMFFCLIGPTAGGKTSVGKALLKENTLSLELSRSATTRAPRAGEVAGKDYDFLSKEEFENKIESGDFVEWENNHGNLYGTLKETVKNANKDLLFDIDVKGAIKLKALFPKSTIIIFFIPPTFEELKERLIKRGSIDEAEMKVRFETMKKEYKILENNKGIIDYFVVNDCFDDACNHARSILQAERCKLARINDSYIKEVLKM